MKKTYCDKCGKEFESFVFQKQDDEAYITVGEVETKHQGEEYEVIRTTHIHVELSARCCGGKPHDLCKPCLLAIIAEALEPKPQDESTPQAKTVKCSACGRTPDVVNCPDAWRWTVRGYQHLHEMTGDMEPQSVYRWFSCV